MGLREQFCESLIPPHPSHFEYSSVAKSRCNGDRSFLTRSRVVSEAVGNVSRFTDTEMESSQGRSVLGNRQEPLCNQRWQLLAWRVSEGWSDKAAFILPSALAPCYKGGPMEKESLFLNHYVYEAANMSSFHCYLMDIIYFSVLLGNRLVLHSVDL